MLTPKQWKDAQEKAAIGRANYINGLRYALEEPEQAKIELVHLTRLITIDDLPLFPYAHHQTQTTQRGYDRHAGW